MSPNESTNALVLSTVEDGVLIVSMNDARSGNAMTVAFATALAEALEEATRRPEVGCVLLRSAARHFCTGGNVKDMQRSGDLMAGSVEEVMDGLRSSLHRITLATQAIDVPVIAAVNGAAVGAGFDLALMCDIRLAGARARFAESFLRLGLISGIGGAWFLARTVGLAKAMELTFTSEFLDAPSALAHGIVSRVVPDADLDAESMALSRRIAEAPPRALRLAKRLVRESAQVPLSAALDMAATAQAILLCGQEHKTAVNRFLASR